MEEKIRTFIAIELPETVRDYLYAVGLAVGQQLPANSVRWVKPEQMHLTLRFLGDTAVSQISPLTQALQTELANQAGFSLKLSQLGAFPNRERPRVIWVGVGGEMVRLRAVQDGVETAVSQIGLPPDKRKFKPHLTIGRVKQHDKVKGKKWGGRVESLGFEVTAVSLIQSTLTPKGSLYKTLAEIEL